MIVWGGIGNTGGRGGRYDPTAETWTSPSTTNAPASGFGHSAVWTGTEMIVWGGGYANTGGRYNPATDTWSSTSLAGAPSGRFGHTAVWTGTKMIIWGGQSSDGSYLNTGGRYDPATNTWSPTSLANDPAGRSSHTAVWTGTRMIIWGGLDDTGLFYTGGRYDPTTDTWASMALFDWPVGRSGHTVVWTGTRMIVWGGFGDSESGYLNTGGLYDPTTDTWAPTSTADAPAERASHTAVWAETQMVVWGGNDGANLNTGGLYDPATDAWRPTTTTSAPEGRSQHTAVWTGTQMIVWGGTDGFNLHSGGLYTPGQVTDADGDGYTNCAGDCDDANPSVYPDALEICNGIDDNCNGVVDEGLGQTTCGLGVCVRTVANCVGGAPQICVPGSPSFDVCDGLDNDCNGVVDDGDADQDGSSVCVDCNDSMASIHPGATELCNGIDDNCNGLIDEDAAGVDSDGDGIRNACDNCPTVSNPDQDPCACGPSCGASDLTVSFDSPEGHGSGVVRWFVARESDIVGFNVVEIDSKGNRTQINPVIIPCAECSSGLGHAYMVIIPKHQSGRSLFVEVVRLHGPVSVYGPAQRIQPKVRGSRSPLLNGRRSERTGRLRTIPSIQSRLTSSSLVIFGGAGLPPI